MGGLTQWLKNRSLRQARLPELSSIAGGEWSTVWRKLELPAAIVCDRAAVAEFSIRGKPAVPVTIFVGFTSRTEVVRALMKQLWLTESEAGDFLDCTRDRGFVVDRVEERLAALDDD